MFYFVDRLKIHQTNPNVLKVLTTYGRSNFSQGNDSHKIIYHDPKNGVYGGGELIQKSLGSFFKEGRIPQNNQLIWVLENVFFEVDHEDILEDLRRFEWHCKAFYESLYEQLINFAINNGLTSVFVYVDSQEYQDMIDFGLWVTSGEIPCADDMILSRILVLGSTFKGDQECH